MRTPDIKEFKAWCRKNASLALTVVKARAFAEVEKERVDAYVLPIFKTYIFRVRPEWVRDGLTNPIGDPEKLYLSDEEEKTVAYYAECDRAHREHGFTGPEGHCPALEADCLRREAEGILIKSGCELMAIEQESLYGEHYVKLLDLLMGACIKAAQEHGMLKLAA